MAEYIEREALLNRLETHMKRITPIEESRDMFFHDSGLNGEVTGALLEVKNAPAADVAPVVHAKWIDGADSFGAKPRQFRVCSRCNICFPRDDRIVPPAYWQGCPNCLARMDGE